MRHQFENEPMPDHADLDPRTPSDGDDGDLGWDGRPIWATAEERAFAASLAELDRADREAGRGTRRC